MILINIFFSTFKTVIISKIITVVDDDDNKFINSNN